MKVSIVRFKSGHATHTSLFLYNRKRWLVSWLLYRSVTMYRLLPSVVVLEMVHAEFSVSETVIYLNYIPLSKTPILK